MGTLADRFVTITGNILLFCLIFCMSATVDTNCLKEQTQNAKAITTGVLLQFLLMPLLGCILVKLLDLEYVTGLMLLVVTCSPGGSYSNWWCSLFNADLALSVTMTAVCTFVGLFMTPFNLYVYTSLVYNVEGIQNVEWSRLLTPILVVIFAIVAGLYASFHLDNRNLNLNANRLGNLAGAALIIWSLIMSNSHAEYQLWDRDWRFYIGVGAPCVLSVAISSGITTFLLLKGPEKVTLSIECCYQNVGIAISIAAAVFDGDELAQAIGVPVYYGVVEALVVGLYCVWAWKNGWTKAPADSTLWQAISTSYEVRTSDEAKPKPQGSIPLETTMQQNQTNGDKEEWDQKDYGDAGAVEPKSDFVDYEEAKKGTEGAITGSAERQGLTKENPSATGLTGVL